MERAFKRLQGRPETDPLLRADSPKRDWEQLDSERHRLYFEVADFQFENDFEEPQPAFEALLLLLGTFA
jgi:shikimate kinase